MNELQFESAAALLDHYADVQAKFYPWRARKVPPKHPLADYLSAPVRFGMLPDMEPPRWRKIIAEVAEKHHVSIQDITSRRRDHPSVLARQEAAWRIRHETPLSLPNIGKRLGGLDHTTILYSVRKHQSRIDAGEAV